MKVRRSEFTAYILICLLLIGVVLSGLRMVMVI